MEGKAILLCLMVIAQLGNSIHVEQCFTGIAFGASACTKLKCRLSCMRKWGPEVSDSYCREVIPNFWHCACVVCDS
uniref:Uncharacterized protein n=1 Tax=Triticum urartu TaxID=4572 RepID=A0A8R7U1M6_TRIUA